MSIFLSGGYNETKKQSSNNKMQQTEEVDTNKIYEVWEVDEPPVTP